MLIIRNRASLVSMAVTASQCCILSQFGFFFVQTLVSCNTSRVHKRRSITSNQHIFRHLHNLMHDVLECKQQPTKQNQRRSPAPIPALQRKPDPETPQCIIPHLGSRPLFLRPAVCFQPPFHPLQPRGIPHIQLLMHREMRSKPFCHR